MTTKLYTPLKREIVVDGAAYTLTLSSDGLKLVPKGHRKGCEISWRSILNGDARLAAALHASVGDEPHRAGNRAGNSHDKL